MADRPLVSVIIPTYNNAAFVCEAVESVLAQTWRPIELFVIDDGSEDDTIERLKAFKSDVRLLQQKHLGPAVARNAGLAEAAGEFVAFLDSDDLYRTDKLERSVEALEQNTEAGVVYTAIRVREIESGLTYPQPQYTMSGWMARELFLECRGVNTSTLVVRREAIDRVGTFDKELFRCQDWDLMLRLAEAYPYVHLPGELTERRLHGRSISVTHVHLYRKYNLLVLEKALARRPDLYRDLKKRAFALAHLRFGLNHYGAYRLHEARCEFRASLAHRWSGRAFNYWLRTWLPESLIQRLRAYRIAREHGAPEEAGEEDASGVRAAPSENECRHGS